MKKLFAFLSIVALVTFGLSNYTIAQEEVMESDTTEVVVEEVVVEESAPVITAEEEKPQTFHEILKEKFIEGGPGFMGIVLLALIFGLAIWMC